MAQKFAKGYLVSKTKGVEFKKFQADLRAAKIQAILLQRRTNAQVLIAYRWRRFWVSINITYMTHLTILPVGESLASNNDGKATNKERS